MSATYLSHTVMELLDDAQAVIERHLTSCQVCGTNRPCRERREAEALFLRFGRLPRRRPGLTTHAEGRPSSGSWTISGGPAVTVTASTGRTSTRL